jgi:hypothetical protein
MKMQVYRIKTFNAKDGNQTIFLLVDDYSEVAEHIEKSSHAGNWRSEVREVKLVGSGVVDARRDSGT